MKNLPSLLNYQKKIFQLKITPSYLGKKVRALKMKPSSVMDSERYDKVIC